MSEATEVVQNAIPFVGYIAPAMLLLTVVAVADHIIGFLYKIVNNKGIRF